MTIFSEFGRRHGPCRLNMTIARRPYLPTTSFAVRSSLPLVNRNR